MSTETHLCNRCQAIFATGPDLPSVEDGRFWTEVCGMFHKQRWTDESVDMAALMQSANDESTIATSAPLYGGSTPHSPTKESAFSLPWRESNTD
jgi:hypothetical protein